MIHIYSPINTTSATICSDPGKWFYGALGVETVYVVVGLERLEDVEALYEFAEELGVRVRLLVAPRRLGVIIVNGLRAESVEEAIARIAEAIAVNVNLEGLILACCS